MIARPEITVSMPPDVANLPAPIKRLVDEHERLIAEYRSSTQTLSDLDADRQHVEQRDAEDSAKALRAGKPVTAQAHLQAHLRATGAARHLATSLATAADGAASDLIAAVDKARPAIFAKADDDIAVAEQVYAKALERLEQAHLDLTAARSQAGWIARFPANFKAANPTAIRSTLIGQNGSEITMGTVLEALKSAA